LSSDDDDQAYGQLTTRLSRDELAAALAGRCIEVVPAAYVLRLFIDGERIEFEPVPHGYILSSNNAGPAWLAGLRRLSTVLSGLGVRHRFEFMKEDQLTERLHHDWPSAAPAEDEK
jgi:hypothetical protein